MGFQLFLFMFNGFFGFQWLSMNSISFCIEMQETKWKQQLTRRIQRFRPLVRQRLVYNTGYYTHVKALYWNVDQASL